METIELHNRGEGETYLEHLEGKDWVLRCTPKYRQEYTPAARRSSHRTAERQDRTPQSPR